MDGVNVLNKLILTLLTFTCLLVSACGVYDEEMKIDEVVATNVPVNDVQAEEFFLIATSNNHRELEKSIEKLNELFNNSIDDKEEITKINTLVMDIAFPSDTKAYYLGIEDHEKYEPTLALTKELEELLESVYDDVREAETKYDEELVKEAQNKMIKVEELTSEVINQFENDKNK